MARGSVRSIEVPGELALDDLYHALAQGQEVGDETARLGSEGAALRALAANLGLHQRTAQDLFRLLDPPPDVAVALVEVGGSPLDGAGPVHGLQDLADAEAKGVAALGLQPDLDSWG